jgi:hypothetical protein
MNPQLEFFPKTVEEECLTQMEEFKKHLDKIRKSLYARDSQLRKEFNETKHELMTLKQAMCQNKKELF